MAEERQRQQQQQQQSAGNVSSSSAGGTSAGGPSARERRAEAGTEREHTYGVLPRSLEDVAAEAEEGKREYMPAPSGIPVSFVLPKDQLHWAHGIHHVKAAHGAALTERARELVRRALGELYQEAQGAEPASKLAHEVADSLRDTEKLNTLGDEQHASEHRRLNQRGQALLG